MIYIDTSAFLDRMLGQNNHVEITTVLKRAERASEPTVSSRLLQLEARRVQVRESLDPDLVQANVDRVHLLPMTEEVWQGAFKIESHVRTLDALHLATCSVVQARLMTSDVQMAQVADDLGIDVVPL